MVAHRGPQAFVHRQEAANGRAGRDGRRLDLEHNAVATRLSARELRAMARGYEAMSELNLALAKEDEATLAEWPDFDVTASEADPSGDS